MKNPHLKNLEKPSSTFKSHMHLLSPHTRCLMWLTNRSYQVVDQATDFPFWSQTNLFIQQSTLGPLTAKKLISFLGTISFSILGTMSSWLNVHFCLGTMSFLRTFSLFLRTLSFGLFLCPVSCPHGFLISWHYVLHGILALCPPWLLHGILALCPP